MGIFADNGERTVSGLGAEYAGGAVKKLPKGTSLTALAVTDRRVYYSRQQSEITSPDGKTGAAYSDTVIDLGDVSAVTYGYEPKRIGWMAGILLFLFMAAAGAVLAFTVLSDWKIPVLIVGFVVGLALCLAVHFIRAARAKKRRVMSVTVAYAGGSLTASFVGAPPEKVREFRNKLFAAKDALCGRAARAGFSTADIREFSASKSQPKNEPVTPAQTDVFDPFPIAGHEADPFAAGGGEQTKTA